MTFLRYSHQIPSLTLDSERQFLAAFAFLGYPPAQADNMLGRWAFAKTLKVYDVVASLYRQSEVIPEPFHFAHGDLSEDNYLD